MTEQTRTNVRPAGARLRLRQNGPGGTAVAACLGLVLGLLALGPGLLPGYLLSYDMVFVPAPQFNAAVLGIAGTLPRAVPSDAVVAVLARALPADVVQKLILLAIFVLACAGAARLLSKERLPAQLAAGVIYTWNPFVAERLILGQWALLFGYAGLPWVLGAVLGAAARPGVGVLRRAPRLAIALLPAAIGGFAAMAVSALVAVPAALTSGADGQRTARSRLVAVGLTAAIMGLLSLPWLIPSLSRQVHTSTAGVAAFAARADTPFGTAGSLLMLGGGWNAQAVPAGYGGWLSVLTLCLAIAGLGGYLLLGGRRWPGLGVGAAAGLVVALLGAFGPGQDLLRSLITAWPGFAVLRDGQQFIAPLALAEATGTGLVVAWLLRLDRPRAAREGRAVLAAAVIVLPLVVLPGLAWGAAGRLRPVEYPADWLAARRLINSDPVPGRALLLPWGAYRRFSWNHDEALLDPWPRLLARQVVWDDGVQVGSLRVAPEDPAAIAIGSAVNGSGPLTTALRAHGYRYVIVDAGLGRDGQEAGISARLAGCPVVLMEPGLTVYRVPD
jgi:hypothetical protein